MRSWPALALAYGFPLEKDSHPRIPSSSQQCKRGKQGGAPLPEALFVLSVLTSIRRRLSGARDLIIDSVPILAWHRSDPDAAFGHAPSECIFVHFYVAIVFILSSVVAQGSPFFFLLSPAKAHDAPFAKPLLAWTVQCYRIRPRVIRLDAAYWGLRLIAWIHSVLGAIAVIPWNPKRQKNRFCLPPTQALRGSRQTHWHRTFRMARVFLFFHLQRPPLPGWSTISRQVALTYTATIIVALAAQQAGRPDLIRSPKSVLAHTWEGF